MAKGQRRSSREAKKPKKPIVPGQAKNGVASTFSPPTGTTYKLPTRKT